MDFFKRDAETFGKEDGDIDDASCQTSSGSGNPAWHFTIVSSAFCLGNVYAPYTLGAGGWFWGTVFWVYSSLTTWLSGVLIGRCVLDGAKRGVGSTYPEMMADAFGRPGYWFTIIMQVVTYYMLVTALLVNFANWLLLAWQAIHGAEGDVGLCLWQWILVGGAILTLLSQIQTFRQILPLAILSLFTTIARQFIMYYQIFAADLITECSPEYGGVTARSASTSLSVIAFLFGGHGMFPEEIREMRNKEDYFGALHAMYIIVILVYASNAYVAYFVWGDWVAGDIQFNWPLNGATFISALLSALWVLIEIAISHVMFLGTLERTVIDLERLTQNASKSSKAFVRTVLRSAIVWSEVAIAIMFAAAGIADIQALIGAFGFSALTYYMPFAAYWKLIAQREKQPLWMQLLCGATFLSGIGLMIVGVYASVVGIAEGIAKYSLFDTTICSSADIVDLGACNNPCRNAYGYDNRTCPS